jgi:hypothetical protein
LFDISEARLGERKGRAPAKPMEPTLEGLRRAGEIVSRWSWIHLKVGELKDTDISSMAESVYEKHHVLSEIHRPTGVSL